MPAITSLRIAQFRNLNNVCLDGLSPVNLFWGNNGSGKTSFLEALYFATTGRSFRSSQVQHCIQQGFDEFGIAAEFHANDQQLSLGIRKGRGPHKQITWDGEKVSGFSAVAQAIPVQFISTISYRFFTDGPKIRRQFFDWATFHAEPAFYDTWKQWQRLLKQRNACLKQRRSQQEVASWDAPLIEQANLIDAFRQQLVNAFQPLLLKHLDVLAAPFTLQLSYERGWSHEGSLADLMKRNLDKDYQLGYTQLGPQRADFPLHTGESLASTILSQGQLKLSMYAMHLTQGAFLKEKKGVSPIYLVDDMASELDPVTQANILTYLTQELKTQLFLTGITADLFDACLGSQDTSFFHVNQGHISEEVPTIA